MSMKGLDKIPLCQDRVETGRGKGYWLHSLPRYTSQIHRAEPSNLNEVNDPFIGLSKHEHSC